MTRFKMQAAGLFVAALLALPAAAQRAPEPIPIALIEGLSGPFANAGEAVHRNLLFAVERVNRRGGVKLPGGARPLELQRYDGKGASEESLAMLRAALDRHVAFIAQGNMGWAYFKKGDSTTAFRIAPPDRRSRGSSAATRGCPAASRSSGPRG